MTENFKQKDMEKLQAEQQRLDACKVENKIREKLYDLLEKTEDPNLIYDILKELDDSKNSPPRSIKKLLNRVEEFIYKACKEAEKITTKLECKMKKMVEGVENEEFKKVLNDKVEGKKDVTYSGQLGQRDINKLVKHTHLAKKLFDTATNKLNEARDVLVQKPAFKKALNLENNKEQHDHSSKITFFSNFVLIKKFRKDHSVDTLPTFHEQMNYETVAAAEKDGVLYLACNYQVSKDSGKVDNNGRAIINTSNYGFGNDHVFITDKLKKLCRVKGIEKVVFIEPKEKPTDYAENRAPHAEMQLYAFAKQAGISFDYIDTSKPPCVYCMHVMDNENINYRKRPGVNIYPKNWRNPKYIKVEVVDTQNILET